MLQEVLLQYSSTGKNIKQLPVQLGNRAAIAQVQQHHFPMWKQVFGSLERMLYLIFSVDEGAQAAALALPCSTNSDMIIEPLLPQLKASIIPPVLQQMQQHYDDVSMLLYAGVGMSNEYINIL